MCGLLCSVCVSSWMPGRLELMQPMFQVTIDRVVVWWWWCVCEFAGGGWSGFSYRELGWYPLIGCVHLANSFIILWGV